jgi:hypothetical protein
LCLHTLATGEHRWLPVGPRQDDRFAAVSPDGRTVATLTGDDDVGYRDEDGFMIVSPIDVDSGQRTPIWAGSGGWSAESTISWSPGGQLIAFTYTAVLDHDDVDADVEWITVVLDLAGTATCQNPLRCTVSTIIAGDTSHNRPQRADDRQSTSSGRSNYGPAAPAVRPARSGPRRGRAGSRGSSPR